MGIADAELFGVTDSTATLSFKTLDRGGEPCPQAVEIHLAGADGSAIEVDSDPESEAPRLVRVEGLTPDTAYDLELASDDGPAPADGHYLPSGFRTLKSPPGDLLCSVATVSDMHYGEEVAGLGPTGHEEPQFHASDEDPPYWAAMNSAVIDDIEKSGAVCVVVKGDLTGHGRAEEFALARADLSRLGAPWVAVLGNHDAMDAEVDGAALLGQPADPVRVVEVPGCSLVLLDTVEPGAAHGRVPPRRLALLDAALAAAPGPVLVFGHHHMTRPEKTPEESGGKPSVFGIDRSDAEALLGVFAAHPKARGYFAGHTHRNRMRTFRQSGDVPFVEVGATKEYPGAWAHYRIHEGGYMQEVRRASSPAALTWADRTKDMFYGMYRPYAFGTLEARCFTRSW